MKKLWVAAAFVATATGAGSGAALAADLPARVYTKAPPMLVQAYDWTGFYLGVNAGVGFGRSLTTLGVAPVFETSRLSPLGGVGGGQIGYNWQTGNFGLGNLVFGVEADIQGAGLTSDRTCGLTFCGPTGFQYSQKLDWFGTARGRIGLATGPVLSYITGGFAFGSVETGFSNPTVGTTAFKETRTGWTIGSGIEAALGGNWTGKIEYLYLDLGTQSALGAIATLPASTFSSDIREHIFRVGLNYRIGGTGLVAPQPVRNWSGWFIGGNGGSATARNATTASFTPAAPAADNRFFVMPDGYFGGAQIGYNWQAANWVYGLEADIQGSSQKDNKTCVVLCAPALGAPGLTVDQKMQWFGTVRGRLGYSVGSSLFYGTGGLAYGSVKSNVNVSFGGPTASGSFSQTKTGWTVGAGLESPFEFFGWFGKNWTSKTEYLYVDLGKTTDTLDVGGGTTMAFTTRAREHIFRTGLNYNFNSPVVAKY